MTYGPKVFRRMFILRRIAAADVAACHAQAQMHPCIPHLQAFLASTRMRFDIFDLTDM